MAATLVVSGGAQGISGCTTASLDTTGATLLVAVLTTNAATNISDNKGNTWTGLTAQTNTGITTRIFYVNSNSPTVGTGHTFTTTSTASVLSIMAFSSGASTPFDVENGTSAASGATIAPGSITPSQDNEIIIAGVTGGNTMTTVSIDAGMTIAYQQPLTGGVCYGSGAAYKIQTTAAAISPTWTFANGSTANISAVIASFKTAAIANTTSMFQLF